MKPVVGCPFLRPAPRHSARPPATQAPCPVPLTPIPSPFPASLTSSWAACFAYQSARTQPEGDWACLWVQSLTLDRCSGSARPLDGWSRGQAAGSASTSHLQKTEPLSSETSPWTLEAAGVHAHSPLPHRTETQVPGLPRSPAWPGGPGGNLWTPVGSGSPCLPPDFHHPHCPHGPGASQGYRAASQPRGGRSRAQTSCPGMFSCARRGLGRLTAVPPGRHLHSRTPPLPPQQPSRDSS